MHASNVALIYNPATTHVTPQFHVTFDDTFSSVASTEAACQETAIESLLQKTSWLHSDEFGPPQAHHYFEPTEDPPPVPSIPALSVQPVSGVLPISCQAYKPVKASSQFDQWKLDNGIAVEVFAKVSLPPSSSTLGLRPSEGGIARTHVSEGGTIRVSSPEGVRQGISTPEGATNGTVTSVRGRPTSIPNPVTVLDNLGLGPDPPTISDPIANLLHLPEGLSHDPAESLCQGAFPLHAYPAVSTLGDTCKLKFQRSKAYMSLACFHITTSVHFLPKLGS